MEYIINKSLIIILMKVFFIITFSIITFILAQTQTNTETLQVASDNDASVKKGEIINEYDKELEDYIDRNRYILVCCILIVYAWIILNNFKTCISNKSRWISFYGSG